MFAEADGAFNDEAVVDILECCRDLARWFYGELQDEYEYLTGDEQCRERLVERDLDYDEEGNEI
jgi:hypothetical protein